MILSSKHRRQPVVSLENVDLYLYLKIKMHRLCKNGRKGVFFKVDLILLHELFLKFG